MFDIYIYIYIYPFFGPPPFTENRQVSSVPLDVAMLLMPLTWLVATISARNLRLWTRTLLSASVLALFTGADPPVLGFGFMLLVALFNKMFLWVMVG